MISPLFHAKALEDVVNPLFYAKALEDVVSPLCHANTLDCRHVRKTECFQN